MENKSNKKVEEVLDMEELKSCSGSDIYVLVELIEQTKKNKDYFESIGVDMKAVEGLLECLVKMNYVIIETETNSYASDYNGMAMELYTKMKGDIAEMIKMENFWEIII